MKPVIIIAIAFVLLIPFSALAEVTCPSGSFARTNDLGEIICLDNTKRTPVEPIITPDETEMTGIQIDLTDIDFSGELGTYAVIGIIFLIIVIAIIARLAQSDSKPKSKRKGWSSSQRDQVLDAQDGRCAMCDKHPSTFQFDHIDGDNSNNDIDNCQALCPNCHDRKSRGLD